MWYALKWDKVCTSEELLALRMHQIAQQDEDIIAASKKSLISQTKSAAHFFEKHKNRIVTGNYEPRTLVLAYNKYLDNQFGKKGLPRWNGPFIVIQKRHDNSCRLPPSAPSGPTQAPSSTQFVSKMSPNFVTEILDKIRSLHYDISSLREDICRVEDTVRMTEKCSKSTHRQVGKLQKSTSDNIEDLQKWNGNLLDGMLSVESAISSLKKFITTDLCPADTLETSFFVLSQDIKSVLSHMSVKDKSFATINNYWGAM
jgi:hypothetical protein